MFRRAKVKATSSTVSPPRNLRRHNLSAGLVTAIVVLGGSGWWGWRAYETRAMVARHLPVPPAVLATQPILRDRIEAAEKTARGWRSAVAGLEWLSRLYQANGFPAEASQAYEGLCQIEPQNPRWPYFLARILAGYGRLDNALPLLERTIKLAPDYAPARLQLAEVLMKTGQARAAEAVYQAMLGRDAGNVYAQLGLARLDLVDQRWTEARERLHKITEAQPDFAPAWSLLASMQERAGDPAKLEEARSRGLNSGLHVMPDPWLDELMTDCFDLYRLEVAAVGAAATDPAKTVLWLQRALALDPTRASSNRLLGEQRKKSGDNAEARRLLERATELQPDEEKNWVSLFDFLNTTGDAPAGEAVLARGLVHCPQSHALLLEKGRLLFARHRCDEALATLKVSRQLNPEDIETYVGIGLIYFQQGEVAAGVAEMSDALKLDPRHPVALVVVALNAIALGDEISAKDWFGQVRRTSRVSPQDLKGVEAQFQAKFGHAP